jgi:hypothetical protein
MITNQATLECERLADLIERMLQTIKPTVEPEVFKLLLKTLAEAIGRQSRPR